MAISREEAENWLFNGCCPCFDVNNRFCAKHTGEIIELLRHPKLTVERVKGMIENDIATFTENIKLSNSSLEKSKLNYVKYYCKRLLIRLKEIKETENE